MDGIVESNPETQMVLAWRLLSKADHANPDLKEALQKQACDAIGRALKSLSRQI